MMLSLVITVLEKVLMGMFTKLCTEAFAAKVIEPLVVAGLRRLAENSKSKVDDEIVDAFEATLKQ